MRNWMLERRRRDSQIRAQFSAVSTSPRRCIRFSLSSSRHTVTNLHFMESRPKEVAFVHSKQASSHDIPRQLGLCYPPKIIQDDPPDLPPPPTFTPFHAYVEAGTPFLRLGPVVELVAAGLQCIYSRLHDPAKPVYSIRTEHLYQESVGSTFAKL